MTIIGIDLGTTHSAVAVWQDDAPRIIPDGEGRVLTPSVTAWSPENGWVVGHPARDLLCQDPLHAIRSVKRLMGRRMHGLDRQALDTLHLLYEIAPSEKQHGGVEVVVGDRHLTPQEVSAMILDKLKKDAESFLGHRVDQAVITVPAYFNAAQRQATRDAGRLVGLEVSRVINEPTAAWLSFGYQRIAEPRRTVAVYDLGGGTFDISILQVGRGPFRVLATNGDPILGGDDLDHLIVTWMCAQLDGVDELPDDPLAMAGLTALAEQAKITLSREEHAVIQVPGRFCGASEDSFVSLTLTAAQLMELAEPFINKTFERCRRALADAGLGIDHLAEVLMVGGQTRLPSIRSAVGRFFAREVNCSVNPDEVVALGAAVQAAMLDGNLEGLALADVVPLTLGVRTENGLMDAIVHRNTSVPYEDARDYTTTTHNQGSVEITIYQGEKPQAEENIKLGSFVLAGIHPAPAGTPHIRVTFRVDRNGILKVMAEDVETGQSRQMTITDSVRLSDEEIQQMIEDAQRNANTYAARRRHIEIEQKIKLLQAAFQRVLEEKGESIRAETRMALNETEDTSDEAPETRLARLRKLWQDLAASNRDIEDDT